MFDIHRVELDWGGRKLTLETGNIARQADGAVIATYGETTVIATVVAAKQPKPGIDFLPLTVNYTEKYYAAGRIPGGYFKRERGPTEKDTLTSRLIDRPIRPLFADGWRCDTQVIITVLSHDMENDPDIVAMVAASAALTLSGAPFMGPIGGARVGFSRQRIRPQPDHRRDEGKQARSRRRRHPGRRDDGRVRSAGADRRDHARRRDVRPPPHPAGDRRDHQPGRKRGEGAVRLRDAGHIARSRRRCSASSKPTCARPTRSRARPNATTRSPRSRRRRWRTSSRKAPTTPTADAARGRRVQGTRSQHRPPEHPRHRQAHRRPRPRTVRPIVCEVAVPAAHPRLGPVHPRRNPGDRGRHARHRRGRAVHRRAAGHLQRGVPAALQLPALLGR